MLLISAFLLVALLIPLGKCTVTSEVSQYNQTLNYGENKDYENCKNLGENIGKLILAISDPDSNSGKMFKRILDSSGAIGSIISIGISLANIDKEDPVIAKLNQMQAELTNEIHNLRNQMEGLILRVLDANEQIHFREHVLIPLDVLLASSSDAIDILTPSSRNDLIRTCNEKNALAIIDTALSIIENGGLNVQLEAAHWSDEAYNSILRTYNDALDEAISLYEICKRVTNDTQTPEERQQIIEKRINRYETLMKEIQSLREEGFWHDTSTQPLMENLINQGGNCGAIVKRVYDAFRNDYYDLGYVWLILCHKKNDKNELNAKLHCDTECKDITILEKRVVVIRNKWADDKYQICTKYDFLRNERQAWRWCYENVAAAGTWDVMPLINLISQCNYQAIFVERIDKVEDFSVIYGRNDIDDQTPWQKDKLYLHRGMVYGEGCYGWVNIYSRRQ